MSKKSGKLFSKRTSSLFIISNLILSIFAFTFLVYSASVVSGQSVPSSNLPERLTAPSANTPAAAAALSNTPKTFNFGKVVTLSDSSGLPVTFDASVEWAHDPSSGLYQTVTPSANGQFSASVDDLAEATGLTTDQIAQKAGVELQNTNPIGINFGTGTGAYFANNILTGFYYSLLVIGGIQLIGGLFGVDSGLTNALSLGAFAGIQSAEIAKSLFSGSNSLFGTGMGGGIIGTTGIGIAIGLIVFAATYKSTDTETISFQCNVWRPPRGGEDCEKCNVDSKNFPCTEYRCKSLGAACQLLNAGSGEEKCAWVNSNDVNSPTISPNYENISSGYSYENVHIRPPGLGMEIKNANTEGNEDGCVEAFFPLEFGVVTNEPTQCKIDYNHTSNFDDMQYDFGGSSTYKYNHTQTLSLPGPANLNRENPELRNDGVYNLFIRCQDPNGNTNEDEFVTKFCVKPGPDTTPARIETTSLINGMPISYNKDKLNITVFTNEPADCKWSHEDKDYDVMENTMTCSQSVTEFNANLLYTCSGNLNEIEDRKDNDFYFRCKDQPGALDADRNVNEESYKFTVKGTQPLNILRSGPNGTIMGSTSIVSVNLEVETGNGFRDGDAICYFSTTGNENDYVKFFETGSFSHRQRQDLVRGDYTYYFKCVDLGGNADYNKTKFRVEIDDKAPRVVRVKHDAGESSVCGAAGCIQVLTDENSQCSYSTTSCNFELNNGIKMPFDDTKVHYAEWTTDFNYYIKCQDNAGNQPGPASCSMIVKAYNSK